MYIVQVYTLTVHPSYVYSSIDCLEQGWNDLAVINQLETDDEELDEARDLMRVAKYHYFKVRIVKSLPSGLLQHVDGD